MINQVGLKQAMKSLEHSGCEFKVLFETGSLSVELYKPDRIDRQQPHDRDEIYLIASGSGKFQLENNAMPVETGDFLFVPAKARHHFFEFTDDFSTWVFFYGVNGGEQMEVKNYLKEG